MADKTASTAPKGDVENKNSVTHDAKEVNSELKFSFAGKNAKTADISKLTEAQRMESDGADSETIRKATGWHKGYDGKWRFEIDDSKMRIFKNGDALFSQMHPEYAELQELYNKMFYGNITEAERNRLKELDEIWGGERARLAQRVDSGNATLENIIQHDELFEAYPELRNVKIVFEGMGSGTNGSYERSAKTIKLNERFMKNDFKLKDTLLHEVEHAVQDIEGFASGASPEYWKNSADKSEKAATIDRIHNEIAWLEGLLSEDNEDADFIQDDIDRLKSILSDIDYHLYENTAGEIEARDVSSRANMNTEQRKNTRPDIDRTDVVFADDGESYSVSEEFSDYLKKAIEGDSSIEKEKIITVSNETPLLLLENEKIENLSVKTRYHFIYLSARATGEFEGNYHNLGAKIEEALSKINESRYVILTQKGRYNFVGELNSEGKSVVISLEPNATTEIDNKYVQNHFMLTIFEAKERYITNNIIKNAKKIVYEKNKDEESQVNRQRREWMPIVNDSSSSTNTIHNPDENVNSDDDLVFSASSDTGDGDSGVSVMPNGEAEPTYSNIDMAPLTSAEKMLRGGMKFSDVVKKTGISLREIALDMESRGESAEDIRELTGLYRDNVGGWQFDGKWLENNSADINASREAAHAAAKSAFNITEAGITPGELEKARTLLEKVNDGTRKLLKPTAEEHKGEFARMAAEWAIELAMKDKMPTVDAVLRSGATLLDMAKKMHGKYADSTIKRVTGYAYEGGEWVADQKAMLDIIKAGGKELIKMVAIKKKISEVLLAGHPRLFL